MRTIIENTKSNIIILWHSIKYGFRQCKWFFQRVFRGYSDDELWNLDYTIAKWILPRLKAFKKDNIGWPVHFDSFTEWTKTIDEMIWSFDFIVNQDKYEDKLIEKYGSELDENGKYKWIVETEKLVDRCNKGLELFAKHYRNLWW